MRRRRGVSGALLASLAMLLMPSCVHPHDDPSQLALPPLRGGGRSLPPRKGVASGNLKKRATAGLSMTPAVGESQPTDTADKREGPAKSPDWGRARATGSSRRLSEVAMMIQDAVAEDPAAEDEVGLPYQQLTPLVSGHTDVKRARDAQSYCAEAARCLANFELEGAEACYQEALKLAPAKVRSNVCLRAHDTCTCTKGDLLVQCCSQCSKLVHTRHVGCVALLAAQPFRKKALICCVFRRGYWTHTAACWPTRSFSCCGCAVLTSAFPVNATSGAVARSLLAGCANLTGLLAHRSALLGPVAAGNVARESES